MFRLNPKFHMSDKCARCGGPSLWPMIPNDLRKGQVEEREGGALWDGGHYLTPKMHWWLFLQADRFSCTHTGARPHMQLDSSCSSFRKLNSLWSHFAARRGADETPYLIILQDAQLHFVTADILMSHESLCLLAPLGSLLWAWIATIQGVLGMLSL